VLFSVVLRNAFNSISEAEHCVSGLSIVVAMMLKGKRGVNQLVGQIKTSGTVDEAVHSHEGTVVARLG